jgi:hypothetical protein
VPDGAAGDGEPVGVACGRIAALTLSGLLGNEYPPDANRRARDGTSPRAQL